MSFFLTFIGRVLPVFLGLAALVLAAFLAVALTQRDAAREERDAARQQNATYAQTLLHLQARHAAELAVLDMNAKRVRQTAAAVAEQKEKINAQDGFESSVRAALDGVRDLRAMRAGSD